MQASKPLCEWSIEDVVAWFQTYKGGKYAADAKLFDGLDGDELYDLTEAQFKSRSTRGDILFNAIARVKSSPQGSPTSIRTDEIPLVAGVSSPLQLALTRISISPSAPALPSPTLPSPTLPPPPKDMCFLSSEALKNPLVISLEKEHVVDVFVDVVVEKVGESNHNEAKSVSVIMQYFTTIGDVRLKLRGGLESNKKILFFLVDKLLSMSESLVRLGGEKIEVHIYNDEHEKKSESGATAAPVVDDDVNEEGKKKFIQKSFFWVPHFYHLPLTFVFPPEVTPNDGKEEINLWIGEKRVIWRLDPSTTLGEFREKIRSEIVNIHANSNSQDEDDDNVEDGNFFLVDFYYENKPQSIRKVLEDFSKNFLEVRIGDQQPQKIKLHKISGQLQGIHKITFASGDVYEGEWVNGVRSGWGKQVWVDSACYEGIWVDGKAHGRGVYKYPNGALYEGSWKEGKKFGFGRCTYQHGAVYEGEWNNVKQGFGKQTYPDGKVFEGYWKANKRHGLGKQTKDGHTITGEWADNQQVKVERRPERRAPDRPKGRGKAPPPPALVVSESKTPSLAETPLSPSLYPHSPSFLPHSPIRSSVMAQDDDASIKTHWQEDGSGKGSTHEEDGFVRQRSVVVPSVFAALTLPDPPLPPPPSSSAPHHLVSPPSSPLAHSVSAAPSSPSTSASNHSPSTLLHSVSASSSGKFSKASSSASSSGVFGKAEPKSSHGAASSGIFTKLLSH